jgi:protocatechuate 3,4-dioxygenase alpha subunit
MSRPGQNPGLGQTPSQTVGPFFHYGLVFGGENILVNAETRGQHIELSGAVRDGDNQPVSDALIEIWQPDAAGIFNHPADPQSAHADPHFRGWGRAATDENGIYRFATVKPGVITAAGQEGVTPYINVCVFARGMLTHLFTRIYFPDEPGNSADPLLATLDSEQRSRLTSTRSDRSSLPAYRFDISLQGEHETVFLDP